MSAGSEKRKRVAQAAATYRPTLTDTASIVNQGANTLIALKQLELAQTGPYDKLAAYGASSKIRHSLSQISKDANLVRSAHSSAMGRLGTLMDDEYLDLDSLNQTLEELKGYDVSSDTSGALQIEKDSLIDVAEAKVLKKSTSEGMTTDLDKILTGFEAERNKNMQNGNLVFNKSDSDFGVKNMTSILNKIYDAEERGLIEDNNQYEKRAADIQEWFRLRDALQEFDKLDETQLTGKLAQKWDEFIPDEQWDITDVGQYKTSSGNVISGSVSDALLASSDLLESGDVKGAKEYYDAAYSARASTFREEVQDKKAQARAGLKKLTKDVVDKRKVFGDNLSDLASVVNNSSVGKVNGALEDIVDPLPSAAQGTVGWETMEGQAARNALNIMAHSDEIFVDSGISNIAQAWRKEGSSHEDAIMILNQIRKYGVDPEQKEFEYKGEKYDLSSSLYNRIGKGDATLYKPTGKEGGYMDYPGVSVGFGSTKTANVQRYMVDVLNVFEAIQNKDAAVDIANLMDPDGDFIVNNPEMYDEYSEFMDSYTPPE